MWGGNHPIFNGIESRTPGHCFQFYCGWLAHRYSAFVLPRPGPRISTVVSSMNNLVDIFRCPAGRRSKVERCCADPISQCAPLNIDARSSEDMALPVQGQIVRVFADENIRDEAFGLAGHSQSSERIVVCSRISRDVSRAALH